MDQEVDYAGIGGGGGGIVKHEEIILADLDTDGDHADGAVKDEESTGSAASPVFPCTKKRLRSKAWDDFTPIVVAGKVEKAVCNHCRQVFTSRSCNGTSNLLKHIAKCKPLQIHKNQQKLQFTPPTPKHAAAPDFEGRKQQKLPFLPSAQKGPANAIAGTAPEQQKLAPAPPALPNATDDKNSKFDQNALYEELICMFVKHGYPLSMADGCGFRKFAACLNPMFKMPSLREVERQFIALFEKEKAKLKQELALLSSRVSLRANVWHYDRSTAYFCLTAHYIDNEWQKQKRIITFCRIKTSSSAKELSEVILAAIRDWGLNAKVFSITLDDAIADDSVSLNVKRNLLERNLLLMDGKLFQGRCVTHILDHIVQVGLEEVETILQKSRKSVKLIQGSTPSALLESNPRYMPSSKYWRTVEAASQLLEKFHRSIEALSNGSSPVLHFDKLCEVCHELDRASGTYYKNEPIDNMIGEMLTKFMDHTQTYHLHFSLPIILDPWRNVRYIEHRVRHAFGIPDYALAVRDAMSSIFDAYSSQVTKPSSCSRSQSDKEIVINGDDPLLDHDHHIVSQPELAQTELETYLEQIPDMMEDPHDALRWWKKHNSKYPTIACMARDILAIPLITECTSAISTARNVFFQSSGFMMNVPMEALVCTRDWIRSSGPLVSMKSIQDLQNGNCNLPKTPSSSLACVVPKE